MLRALLLAVVCSLGACSTQNWYEGLREGARQECRKTPGSSAARDCVDRVDRQTYDAYQADRARPPAAVINP